MLNATIFWLATLLAIRPSTLTVPPLAPKVIVLDVPLAAVANVFPAPDVNRSSAFPPAVAALIVTPPPAPRGLLPAGRRGISPSLENNSTTPAVMVVPP